MLIAQQLMLLVLRNAFDILVLTAVNHSETDWNIRHGFRIWAWKSEDAFDVVFGVRSECAEIPKKKIKKIGNSEKKKFGSRRFWRVGRSTAN